jgi:hypothetical protein
VEEFGSGDWWKGGAGRRGWLTRKLKPRILNVHEAATKYETRCRDDTAAKGVSEATRNNESAWFVSRVRRDISNSRHPTRRRLRRPDVSQNGLFDCIRRPIFASTNLVTTQSIHSQPRASSVYQSYRGPQDDIPSLPWKLVKSDQYGLEGKCLPKLESQDTSSDTSWKESRLELSFA